MATLKYFEQMIKTGEENPKFIELFRSKLITVDYSDALDVYPHAADLKQEILLRTPFEKLSPKCIDKKILMTPREDLLNTGYLVSSMYLPTSVLNELWGRGSVWFPVIDELFGNWIFASMGHTLAGVSLPGFITYMCRYADNGWGLCNIQDPDFENYHIDVLKRFVAKNPKGSLVGQAKQKIKSLQEAPTPSLTVQAVTTQAVTRNEQLYAAAVAGEKPNIMRYLVGKHQIKIADLINCGLRHDKSLLIQFVKYCTDASKLVCDPSALIYTEDYRNEVAKWLKLHSDPATIWKLGTTIDISSFITDEMKQTPEFLEWVITTDDTSLL